MMIKGIDIGYTNTKDEARNIFASAFSTSDLILGKRHALEVNGETYYIGNGSGTIELDKCETMLNKLCMLTCLGLSDATDFYLVTGLPIGQYKAQKQKLRDYLLDSDRACISLNGGRAKIIRIHDVMVFPQGAAALYSQSIQGDAIVIDVGGRTVDIALVEHENGIPNLSEHTTLYCGTLKLYSKIMDSINAKFSLGLEARYAEKILQQGLRIDGTQQDITFLSPIMREHFNELIEKLSTSYPASITPIYLCGGGANYLYKALSKRFPNVTVLTDSQFANAIGFYNIGVTKFGKYEQKGVRTWQPQSV